MKNPIQNSELHRYLKGESPFVEYLKITTDILAGRIDIYKEIETLYGDFKGTASAPHIQIPASSSKVEHGRI
ncbi:MULTISPECIES: hypothetical protein [Bacillus cereus group]|uniref:hypothetical protein n=1 Tax=Bacillus cereus group TaxID=86661 RepID=UPI000B4C2074|nr:MULTISPECIES: hypothetical protein [Bacillus cereus group]MDA1576837.1 hypothetical protein [Bacillus cereus group sp. TH242-3LC]RRA94937.1 hypothetical protein EH195_28305 [Bacillus pacificus]